MQNKKQFFNQLERTIKWNIDRGNTPDTLNWSLEYNMLLEEVQELGEAYQDVDRFDAILDIIFVAFGTLGKMGLDSGQIVDGYEAVLRANETKSKTKDKNGKITKPKDFVGPEDKLQKILQKRIYNE